MSEDRETPAGAGAAHDEPTNNAVTAAPEAGSPVEENEATTTEVRAAVDRAGALGADSAPARSADVPVTEASAAETRADAADGTTALTPEAGGSLEPATESAPGPAARPEIAMPDELPTAGPGGASATSATSLPAGATTDTDGNIVISSDHPMAALYMQTPMPPDLRGNRGAGVLISVLATIAFAVVYTGVLALWIAPSTPPSRFVLALTDTALWPVVGASALFFIGLVILVLVVGRAGWWAYVLGGFLVGVLAWAGAILGLSFSAYQEFGASGLVNLSTSGVVDVSQPGAGFSAFGLVGHFGLAFSAIAAGVVGREITVWFGAWIGARGRKVTRKNSEVLAEYERSLAEAQAKQP